MASPLGCSQRMHMVLWEVEKHSAVQRAQTCCLCFVSDLCWHVTWYSGAPGLHGGANAGIMYTAAHWCGMTVTVTAHVFILQQMHSHVCCLSRNWPCTQCSPFYHSLHIRHCLLLQNNFCESERGWEGQMGQTVGRGKPCLLLLTTWIFILNILVFSS